MKIKIVFYKVYLPALLWMLSGKFCIGQTFNCYIANDHLVSATQFELDVFIQSTSTDFNLRTVQNCITFNPAFIPAGSNIVASLVAGSSQMVSYFPATVVWSTAGFGFQTSANTGVTCPTGTLITTTSPVRVGTFRLVSNLPFNCSPSNPNMVLLGDSPAPSGLALRMAVTKWNSINCTIITSTTITSTGTFSQATANTAYTNVNNMCPVINNQPLSVSTSCLSSQSVFSVTATGNTVITSSITYQWLENGIPISNGTTSNATYSGATSPTLTITSPTGVLNGSQYSCIVTQCNSVTSSAATLTINGVDDNNACTQDNCDPITGNITHTTLITNDNDACTTDGCDPVTGVFHIQANINDSNVCTTDACNPSTGNITHIPLNTNDNNVCTTDGCDPVTGVFHNQANISDGNNCTIDACNPATGIISHTVINTNDGNACTTDGCDSLTGVFHTPVNVNDSNVCTTDACDPATGNISHNNINVDDGNLCTIDGCDPVTGLFHTVVNINDSNACTTDACDPANGNITHTPKITVNVSSTPATCSANDGTATAIPAGSSSGYSYLWSPGGQTTQTAASLASGTYTVIVSDASHCTGSATAIVSTINLAPSAPGPISGPAGACRNQNGVVYSIANVTGATSYLWTLPSGSSGASNGTSITLNFGGTYNGGAICVQAINSCGTSLNSCINIPVLNSIPSIAGLMNGPPTLCPNTTGNYSVAAVANATSYLWTTTGGLIIVSGQGTNSIIVSAPAGFIKGTVRVVTANCRGKSGKRIKNITGLPGKPVLKFLPPVSTCAGNCYSFNINNKQDAVSWTITAPIGCIITSTGAHSPGNPLTTTKSNVTICFPVGFISGTIYIFSSNACGNSQPFIYSARSTPIKPVSIIGPKNNLCNASGVVYSIAASPGATSYTWTVPPAATITNNIGTSVIVSYGTGFSSGIICVKANNVCGSSANACITVKATPSTPGLINGSSFVCKSQTNVIYSLIPVTGATSYTWTITGGAVITAGAGTASIRVSYINSTTSNVTLSVKANNACGSSLIRTLAISVNLNCKIKSDEKISDNERLNVYPNPSSGDVRVTFFSDNSSVYSIKIVDMIGQVLISENISAIIGINMKEISLEEIARGIYFISLQTQGGEIQTLPLVIQ